MSLAHVVPLAEAAAFTCGCAVLRARWVDPERIGVVLMTLAAGLGLTLIIAMTPARPIDATGVDPDEVHSILD